MKSLKCIGKRRTGLASAFEVATTMRYTNRRYYVDYFISISSRSKIEQLGEPLPPSPPLHSPSLSLPSLLFLPVPSRPLRPLPFL